MLVNKEKDIDSSGTFDERAKRYLHYMKFKNMNEQWIETAEREIRIMIDALADYYDIARRNTETMDIGHARAVWEDRLERIKKIQTKLEDSINYSRDRQIETCMNQKFRKNDDIGEDAVALASRK